MDRGLRRLGGPVWILGTAVLSLGTFLGSSSKLTYHEAFVAQAGREIAAGGGWLVPTINGSPWLEKPPLPFWLVAGLGTMVGTIDETVARLPFALAALALVGTIAFWSTIRFGERAGVLSGLVQATTCWTVARGRLAEADILLAALTTGSIVAFDLARLGDNNGPRRLRFVIVYALLGVSTLVKGIGFGAALASAVMLIALAWDRDMKSIKALLFNPLGLGLALAIALPWPVAVLSRHPQALGLWVHHVSDRLAATPTEFSGERWPQYLAAYFWQTLPWTPLALVGLRRSWKSAWGAEPGERQAHRLLVVWAIVPAAIVSLSPARNAHYLIYSYPPFSAWAGGVIARRLDELGAARRGRARLTRSAFLACGLACAAGFGALAPRFDKRGVEWSFYDRAAKLIPPSARVALVYSDWDRNPYASPFGPVPHDLGVRLFYLRRLRADVVRIVPKEPTPAPPPADGPLYVIARPRDLPALASWGGGGSGFEPIAEGPRLRWDRAFVVYRFLGESGNSD